MQNELELKLSLAPGDAAKLARHPLLDPLSASRPASRRLTSVYYDTPGFALWTAGYALRVRRVGRRWVQTAKGEGRVAAGLHQRREWEAPVAGSNPDLEKLAGTPLEKILGAPEVRESLAPVFTTEFRRTTRELAFADGTRAELAVDRGEVRTDGERLPLCEVEMELKAGSPARLFELALALQKTLPLRLEPESKAERGYRLVQGTPPALVKAAPPELGADSTVNDGFRAILWNCIGQLHANEPGMREGRDPEYLHQMRVALRRMRSALGTFSKIMPAGALDPARADLKWLAGELGPARDWDVFVGEILPPVLAGFPAHRGLAALLDAASAVRAQCGAHARETVASARYQALLLTLGAWLCNESWRSLPEARSGTLDGPLAEFAAAVLDRRYRQVKKRGRRAAQLTPEQRHLLRIAAKKLRYAAEFFSPLYRKRPARDFVRALSRLQDILGALNDAVTGKALLVELVAADAAHSAAADLATGWLAGSGDEALGKLQRTWERFGEAQPFWKSKI
ncbi:MAG: CYTH and CHAD domain-containing protein [Betaproteobacteria bacterium]|nr:CYTH and CHAD domain-containing protein [Betaproteobacteria bacterium]